jgi:very-short-patch-repair endonuclease
MYADEDYDKETFEDNILPSSITLLIHVWMYALAMYNVLLSVRKVKYINTHAKQEQNIRTSDIKNLPNKCIIDLGKEKKIYTYDTDEERDAIFRQYHILSTHRRGHFRHYKNGRVIYIPPTVIHYSEDKLAPDAHERTMNVIYRNSEDFLSDKSYLEADVDKMLKTHGVVYSREQMFSWMGKKRLDFYLSNKKMAIECQGVQHFYKYGADDTELEDRKQRDEDKYNECVANGVTLIYYVSPEIPIPEDMKKKHYYVTDLNELYQMIK